MVCSTYLPFPCQLFVNWDDIYKSCVDVNRHFMAQVPLADFLWFSCSQKHLKSFDFPISWFWADLMNVITETHPAHCTWYIRLYSDFIRLYSDPIKYNIRCKEKNTSKQQTSKQNKRIQQNNNGKLEIDFRTLYCWWTIDPRWYYPPSNMVY